MSDSERSPLLSATPETSSLAANTSIESMPLLANGDDCRYDGQEQHHRHDVASDRFGGRDASPMQHFRKQPRRWPSIIAIALLGLLLMSIIVVAFFVPAAMEEYAKEAAVLEPTNLSLEQITATGVRARIQATFRLDGSRVRNDQVRRVGRLATWLVRELGSEETKVEVYLPEFHSILLGTATVPPLTISIMDGHTTTVDFVADLMPGDADGIRTIANEWLDGRLETVRIQGKADITVKAGIIPLGTHSVSESLLFEGKNLPRVPKYGITRLNFREATLPGQDRKGMVADLSIKAFNQYPIQLDIPSLGFEILVPDCAASDPYIMVADAVTRPVPVRPQSDVIIDVEGLIQELPKSLTSICPNSNTSPLDHLLEQYVSGEDAMVFVRGKRHSAETPDWLADILASVTAPVPFPGRTFDGLIRSFALSDVHFALPNPDDPDAEPTVSGTIVVTAGLPNEMNFDINVTDVRATSDVYYHGEKLGELNLRDWQPANSTRHEASESDGATLEIQSQIRDAPLRVTDGDVFTDAMQALLFSGKTLKLQVRARVDVRVQTVLGELELKDVPAEGKIPIKPLPKGSMVDLAPRVGGIRILETTEKSVSLLARINITNPTQYTALIPAINVHILSNGSFIGEVRAENLNVDRGNNTNLVVGATWNPSLGGDKGARVGRNLLSQYLSGYNTTVTLKVDPMSFPSHPLLGEAFSRLNVSVNTPQLHLPGDGTDDGEDEGGGDSGHFIRDATFHVFSSTATFSLTSPLEEETLYIDHVNATAFYNHTERVGVIEHDLPFAAPPGTSQTPKLAVDWSMGSVGFEKLKKAMGGELKLDAIADVGVRLGNWKETVWYSGRNIGAQVRP